MNYHRSRGDIISRNIIQFPYLDDIYNTNNRMFTISDNEIKTYYDYIIEQLKILYDKYDIEENYKLVLLFEILYNKYNSLIKIQSPSPEPAKKKNWGLGWRGGTIYDDVKRELAEFIVLLKQFTFREMNQINEKRRGLEPLKRRLTSIDNVIPDNIEDLNDNDFFKVVSNVKTVILKMRRGNWQGKLGYGEDLYMLRKPHEEPGFFFGKTIVRGGKTRRKSNRKTNRKSNRKTRRSRRR